MGDLLAILGVLAAIAVGIGAVCFLPGGAALVATALNSRVGQFLIATGAAIVAVLTIRRRAYREGEAAANRRVEQGNAEAASRHRDVERQVAGETDEALRDKLRRYRP